MQGNPTDLSEGSYLSKKETASRIGVTPRTLSNYMNRGIIPFYRIGVKTIRFRVSDIDQAMNRLKVS